MQKRLLHTLLRRGEAPFEDQGTTAAGPDAADIERLEMLDLMEKRLLQRETDCEDVAAARSHHASVTLQETASRRTSYMAELTPRRRVTWQEKDAALRGHPAQQPAGAQRVTESAGDWFAARQRAALQEAAMQRRRPSTQGAEQARFAEREGVALQDASVPPRASMSMGNEAAASPRSRSSVSKGRARQDLTPSRRPQPQLPAYLVDRQDSTPGRRSQPQLPTYLVERRRPNENDRSHGADMIAAPVVGDDVQVSFTETQAKLGFRSQTDGGVAQEPFWVAVPRAKSVNPGRTTQRPSVKSGSASMSRSSVRQSRASSLKAADFRQGLTSEGVSASRPSRTRSSKGLAQLRGAPWCYPPDAPGG